MTVVYFIRHSEALKSNNINNSDTLQVQNEKWPLTENGENIAKEKSKIEELQNFDVVYSSNYVRTISTAKYFTSDKINIDENFGERKFGINNWDELPSDFGERQFNDLDYKIGNGESINEVIKREEESLINILNEYKNKKILIVGHSTALAALFSKWCKINYTEPYTFNGNKFFDGKWNYCETFKLEFDDDNNLINITNVK
ncbi:MAG: histidine phosphatase family protein [Bacilli bacterium]|nr:histidine phosphatase family protein [Bacilli bacterium]